jgi:chemotaxis protein MotB
VTRHVALVAAAWITLIGGCASTPDPDNLRNENRNLQGIVEEQQRRIDNLTTDKVHLDRRVKELDAQLAKLGSAERVVAEAKHEISEHVRQVMERFRGDRDIEVLRTEKGYRFVLREAVLFATAETDLTAEGKRALQRIADVLRGTNERVSIEGHTDDVPVKKPETLKRFPRGNIDLSIGRALAVWDHFSKAGGVDTGRMSVVGFGPNRPLAPNTSDLNRHRNRRVEILVEER